MTEVCFSSKLNKSYRKLANDCVVHAWDLENFKSKNGDMKREVINL